MNELQFPGLYIDDSANLRTILPYLCRLGYYCLILTDSPAEVCTKYGRLHCDYCDGTLIGYCPDTVCVGILAFCLWTVAFHSSLFFLLFPFPCRPSHFLFYPQIISRQRQCTSDQCRDKTQDTGEHTAPTAYVYREYPSAYLSRFVEVFVKSRLGDFAVFRIKDVPVCCPVVAQTIERDSCSTV